jgi:hypothetical protein
LPSDGRARTEGPVGGATVQAPECERGGENEGGLGPEHLESLAGQMMEDVPQIQ